MSEADEVNGNVHAAESALRALGVCCSVEARGWLAVVTPEPRERSLEDAGVRRAVLAALRAYGFTHAAVEPSDDAEAQPSSGAPGR